MKRIAYAAVLAGCVLGTASGEHSEEMVFVSFGGALQEAQRAAFLAPFAQSGGHKVAERSWDGGIGKISVRAGMGVLDRNSLGGQEKYMSQAVSEYGVGAILYSVERAYDGQSGTIK